MSKFSNYNEELEVNAVEDTGVYATGDNMKKYISTMEEKDLEKFVIIKSKLLYVGTDEKETEIANRLGIGGGETTSDAGATVQEVQAIVDGVVEVSKENKENIPVSDTDKTDEEEHFDDSEGLIGTRLFDRSSLNLANGNWNILIEYNNQNKETARYGSGYYWLKKGQKYTIKGEEIEFKNDYVINYKNEEFTILSGRAVNWNVDATLGVPDKIVDGKHTLALNLDPMSLANGRWQDNGFVDSSTGRKFDDFMAKNSDGSFVNTGIRKTGDVKYDNDTKALKFNEDIDSNPLGEGGYVALVDISTDLSNGLTFEFYGNMSRGLYKSSGKPDGQPRLGIFCQTNSLNLINPAVGVRFFFSNSGNILDINGAKIENSNGENLRQQGASHIAINNYKKFSDYGFDLNEDFYITVTFIMSDSEDEEMKDGKFARVEYYINGNQLGYCYFDKVGFTNSAINCFKKNYYFVVGGTVVFAPIDMYYYKGACYCCRLYATGLTSNQVKLNYDMTLKYRDSFKDDRIEN